MKISILTNQKIFLILILLLGSLLLFDACKKEDPCATITCLNNGVCDNGTCDCPPGYSGTYCQVDNACFNVVCHNGGTCVNGTCECPLGLGGPNCLTPFPYGTVQVDSMVVNSYPTTDNGVTWDSVPGVGAAPDIYVNLMYLHDHPYQPSYLYSIKTLGPLTDYTQPTISMPIDRLRPVWRDGDKWILYLSDYEPHNYNSYHLMAKLEFLCDDYRGQSSFTVTSNSSTSPHPITATFYVKWNY